MRHVELKRIKRDTAKLILGLTIIHFVVFSSGFLKAETPSEYNINQLKNDIKKLDVVTIEGFDRNKIERDVEEFLWVEKKRFEISFVNNSLDRDTNKLSFNLRRPPCIRETQVVIEHENKQYSYQLDTNDKIEVTIPIINFNKDSVKKIIFDSKSIGCKVKDDTRQLFFQLYTNFEFSK
jgi:hypothetical protein